MFSDAMPLSECIFQLWHISKQDRKPFIIWLLGFISSKEPLKTGALDLHWNSTSDNDHDDNKQININVCWAKARETFNNG